MDKTLSDLFPQHARATIQQLIANGAVWINGESCQRTARRLAAPCEVAVDFSALPPREEDCHPEDLPLDIVYEDDAIVVVNKSAGMVVHPGNGNRHGTLQSALLFRHPPAAALPRAGIVHRLDKNTSGLLVAAKTETARRRLIEQFKSRDIGREYLAIVHGTPPPTGLIDRPLALDKNRRMAVRHRGKEAITRYALVRQWAGFAMLRCFLETGRTHQIRAHLEYAGFPIVGDPEYRLRARALPFKLERQALHAETLRLIHPSNGESQQWKTAPPSDMQNIIREIEQQNGGTESDAALRDFVGG